MWRMCFWPTILFRRLADGVRVSTAKVISRTARAVPRRERHPGLVPRGTRVAVPRPKARGRAQTSGQEETDCEPRNIRERFRSPLSETPERG